MVEQVSQAAGLARILLQSISKLEDEVALDEQEMRTLVDIRLCAEILCEQLTTAAEEASP